MPDQEIGVPIRSNLRTMKPFKASRTASWVASARTFGQYLPAAERLCTDPYGIRFAQPWLQAIERGFALKPKLAEQLWPRTGLGLNFVHYMQLRTRFIDDAVVAFAESGGTQVVILGAGFDSRALRLGMSRPALTFFEVDHPATQSLKLERLPELRNANVRFVDWNFLERPMAELPQTLRAAGLDPSAKVLTLWEGVTMYLDEAAIDGSVRAVAEYGAAGSSLVFNYMDRERTQRKRSPGERAVQALVASVGEPFTFGWSPVELPGWLSARGFSLREDKNAAGLARQLRPGLPHRGTTPEHRRFVIADRF